MVLRKQRGQMLLIVILGIIVTLTIGLSLATRSITNLRSSTEEAESQKALAAAEAGIERAIQSNKGISVETPLGNGSTFTTNVSKVGEQAKILLNAGSPVSKDEGIDVWFQKHNEDGTLDPLNFTAPSNTILYWSSPGSSTTCGDSAIQVIVLTMNIAGTAKTYRYAYDGCSTRGNHFTAADSGPYNNIVNVNDSFRNKTPDNDLASGLPPGDKVVFMRVVPIYKDAIIAITNGSQLPLQGYQIDSAGKFGEANRKIRVVKGWPQTYLPYLSYGLFVP